MIHDRTRCTFGYLQKAKPKSQSLSRSHIRDLAVIDTTVKSSLDKERRALNWLLDLGYREVHLEEHWSTQELNFVNDLFQIKFQVSHYDNRMDLWIYKLNEVQNPFAFGDRPKDKSTYFSFYNLMINKDGKNETLRANFVVSEKHEGKYPYNELFEMLRIQGMAFITNADWPELSDAWPELETEPTLTFYQNEGRKGPRKAHLTQLLWNLLQKIQN